MDGERTKVRLVSRLERSCTKPNRDANLVFAHVAVGLILLTWRVMDKKIK